MATNTRRKPGKPRGPQRVRKARGLGHERPDEILDAAKEIFLTDGYEAFTTRKLAAKVGLSQTGLYVYFKSRDEILDALCQRAYEDTLATFHRLDAEVADDLERFRTALRTFILAGLERPDEYQIIYMTPRRLLYGLKDPAAEADKPTRGVQVVLWQQDLIKRLIRAGTFRKMDAVLANQIALAAPHGLVAKMIAWPDFPWKERDTLIAALIDVLVAGLKAPPPSA